MKDYQVSYMLGSVYHAYIIEAESEEHAREKVLRSMYHPERLRELKITRHYPEWN